MSLLSERSVLFGINELCDAVASIESVGDVPTDQENVTLEDDLLSDEEEMEAAAMPNTAPPAVDAPNVTVREFIRYWNSPSTNTDTEVEREGDSIYSYRRRIDFSISQEQELTNNPVDMVKQIYDIDGFSGFSSGKLENV